jgi:hypothetical protein
MLAAFALPQIHLGPRDVPIAVTGPKPAADRLTAQLQSDQPGAFEITNVADAARARQLILDREVYGAIVAGAPGPSLMIATAASPAVADALKELANRVDRRSAPRTTVTDVRPLPDDDPNGAGLSTGSLPLVLGGWLAAVIMLLAVRGTSRRLVGAFAFAIVGGLALAAVEISGFGAVDDGAYPLLSLSVALSLAATTWMILGLRSALGNPGLAAGAVLVILVGNPLSGLSSAPEMLPSGWSTLGQLLPPGAGGTLLRSAAYFDGNGSAEAVLTLAGWIATGLAMFLLGERRAQNGGGQAAAERTTKRTTTTTGGAAAPARSS